MSASARPEIPETTLAVRHIASSDSVPSRGAAINWSPALAQALGEAFQVQPETAAVSEGELARQALMLLAEDPQTRQAIETVASNWDASRQKFEFGATLAITTAVLIALQTHVRFDRASDGTWILKIEKKPTSDALLKGLVQKLISLDK